MDQPIWFDNVELPRLEPLDADARADACVVGAGIAGLATAYRLARAGLDVVVLERAGVAAGETGNTSAHLASAQDDRFTRLEKRHGRDGAALAAASHAAAIDLFERVAREEAIECGFRRVPGYLLLGPDHDARFLDDELEAATRAGLDVRRLERAPLPAYDTGPCLEFARQAELHPVRFVAGLAEAIRRAGGRLYAGAHVVSIEDGSPCRVETGEGRVVSADHVVLATNAPTNRYLVTLKMVPYRTFIVALRLTGELRRALYWDTADPYHYVRVARDRDGPVLLVGGGDYQAGTKDEGDAAFDALETWARARFPTGDVARRWAGQVYEPADALAFIGRAATDANVYLCTGDSGQGLTHAGIAALLIPDLVLGKGNPWERLYSPLRVSPRALGDYAADAARAARRYAEWLLPGDVRSEADLPRGHGAVLRRGLTHVAVFRDQHGTLHRRSAVCTHAGCIVHWDSTAGQWICPCHGSRYEPTGEVVNGPAAERLGEVEE